MITDVGTIPAWVALLISIGSFVYARRSNQRAEEVRWAVSSKGNRGGYELRNQGRRTAYGVTYKVPVEVFAENQEVDWVDDETPVRRPVDIPGGSAIYINAFKVIGAQDPHIRVRWYDRPGRRGQTRDWNTELPPPPD